MDRATRRRIEREAGVHRARGKGGRRPRVRGSSEQAEHERVINELAGAGFVIARPRIIMPGDER